MLQAPKQSDFNLLSQYNMTQLLFVFTSQHVACLPAWMNLYHVTIRCKKTICAVSLFIFSSLTVH